MKIIFAFAHPDDETFSSGGTIARLSQEGHEVKLITATYGEAGQVGDPPITTKDKLGEVRKKEQACAAKILGIKEIFFLNLRDGGLREISEENFVNLVLPILEKEKPDMVVTFDKTGGSNHPDHIAMSEAVTKAYFGYQKNNKKHTSLYHTAIPRSYILKYRGTDTEYKAFGQIQGTPDEDITTIVDISDTFDLKIQAFKCHLSQKKDWERLIKRSQFVDTKKEFFQLISENSFI